MIVADAEDAAAAAPPRASVAAVSGDAALLDRLASGPFTGRVHSVFDHAVNLEDAAHGRLYTLASARSDNAPATLVVDAQSFRPFAVRRGAPAAAAGGTLSAGGLVISFDRARPWSTALPPVTPVDPPVRWLQAFVDRHGVAGGIKPRPEPANAVEAAIARTLTAATRGLHSALRGGDSASAYEHAGRLIGLGPGLTPAGDDHLLGLATACALTGSGAGRHLEPLRRAIDDNAHRTNDISRAALAHAVRGRVRESIAALAVALATGDTASLAPRARRVLALGATSGTDILTGLLAGLELTT